MTYILKKLSATLVVTVLATGLCSAATAESALVSNGATSMPVQSYIPFNGGIDLNSNHLLKRGIANYMEGDYTTAAMLLHRALRTNPSEGFANYYMGLTKAKIGNHRAAVKYLARANRVFANAPNSYAALGQSYAQLGEVDKARRVLANLDQIKTCASGCASASEVEAARRVIKSAIGQ